jgi:deoxyadenosine/deoxycytidine kinase
MPRLELPNWSSSAHVVVAGTIAAGKTTLSRALSTALGLPVMAERPDQNPFLERFYADSRRWALTSQLWFALDSARQHEEIHRLGGGVQDHSIYENVHAFGAVFADLGFLSGEEWGLLRAITEPIIEALPAPAVIVVVEAAPECLLARVAARGREYEASLRSDYLHALNVKRRAYFDRWTRSPVLLVDSAAVDLRRQEETDPIAGQVATYLEAA